MLKIHFLNVGHGDCSILEIISGNKTIWGVVDSNRPSHWDEVPALKFLKDRTVKKLDFLCLTHPDYDHFSGMIEILDYFSSGDRSIGQFWDSGSNIEKYFKLLSSIPIRIKKVNQFYRKLFELAECDRIEYIQISNSSRPFRFNETEFVFLAPTGKEVIKYIQGNTIDGDDNPSIRNNANLLSIVFLIRYLNKNVFLTGDALKKVIEKILQNLDLSNNKYFHTIKVPHHGSKISNHNGLWKKFTIPDESIAIISHGCKYNLPDKETVDSILVNKVKLYMTNSVYDIKNSLNDGDLYSTFKDDLIIEGMESISEPVIPSKLVKPYHGNITVNIKDESEITVETEYNLPPYKANIN
jgi:beta-lactamase superfamily II metal-dependent hydrolase